MLQIEQGIRFARRVPSRITTMNLELRHGYVPGALGFVTLLFGQQVGAKFDLGLPFESKVARELSEFLERFDKRLDLFVVAVLEGEIVGSVTIDGSGEPDGVARLRWFAVSPRAQGQGVGRALMTEAMTFCASSNVNHVYLTTIAGLDAARRLYDAFDFKLYEEQQGDQWGAPVREQTLRRVFVA